MTPADRLLDKFPRRMGRRRPPHLRGNELLNGHANAAAPHALSRDRAVQDPAISMSATGTACIGSCAAIRPASRWCSCTAGRAADRAPTIAASSTPSATTSWCSTSAAAASRRLMRAWRRTRPASGRRHRAAARNGRAVDKWLVFGGSWGSTLSLAYAQAHPERVTELVLRGIFLFDQYEVDWLYKEGGASAVYPDKWDEFIRAHPRERARRSGRSLSPAADQRRSRRAACAPPRRGARGRVRPSPCCRARRPSSISPAPKSPSPSPGSRIITWPAAAGSAEGELLRGAEKLRGIPGVIVQGRHDTCTPPKAAWALKKAWPEVELQIVPDGGHLYNEPGILDGLIRATDRFAGAEFHCRGGKPARRGPSAGRDGNRSRAACPPHSARPDR